MFLFASLFLVAVESWFDDDKDRELLGLLPFLEKLACADDVRPLIAKRFGLSELVARADLGARQPAN